MAGESTKAQQQTIVIGAFVTVGAQQVESQAAEAVKWFRPGKLTTSLLKQLGRWDAELLGDEGTMTRDDGMTANVDLLRLLESPVESLEVEYKSWIDIGETPGRATLAKTAIALANHGGGVIVFGMRHEGARAIFSRCLARRASAGWAYSRTYRQMIRRDFHRGATSSASRSLA